MAPARMMMKVSGNVLGTALNGSGESDEGSSVDFRQKGRMGAMRSVWYQLEQWQLSQIYSRRFT